MAIVKHAREGPPDVARGEAGQWVSTATAFIAAAVVALSLASLFASWWTDHQVTADEETTIDVTVWVTTTTVRNRAEEGRHEGCTNACDQTRTQFNKENTYVTEWDVRCRTEDDLRETCTELAVVRYSMCAALLFGFLHIFPTCSSFIGAGQRSFKRIGPMCGLTMAVGTFLSLVAALIASAFIDIPEKLGGTGRGLAIAALLTTLANIALCGVAVVVTAVVAKANEEGVVRQDPTTQLRPKQKVEKHAEDRDKLDLAGLLMLADARRTMDTTNRQQPAIAWGEATDDTNVAVQVQAAADGDAGAEHAGDGKAAEGAGGSAAWADHTAAAGGMDFDLTGTMGATLSSRSRTRREEEEVLTKATAG